MKRVLCTIIMLCLSWGDSIRAEEPQTLELTVDGVQRTALVYAPPAAAPGTVPLVFVFHGHGGDSHAAVGSFGINRLWPEAISVYPQGLPIPSLTDPEGKRAGWQHEVGEVGDRDLHFFDALLERLEKEHPVDTKRIYCTGHSNGGGFTYLLWLARPKVFAAVAACSAGPKFAERLTSKPAMIAGGRQDPIVPFAHQQATAEAVRKVDACEGAGEPWEGGQGTRYASRNGTPVVTYFYDGGHGMTTEEPGLVVQFFQHLPIR